MIIYDIETYPNAFTLTAKGLQGTPVIGNEWRYFEISFRRGDGPALMEFFRFVSDYKYEMCGFNNVGFDYIVLHEFIKSGGQMTYEDLYAVAMKIINSNDRFKNMIWPDQRFIPQVDLYLIHHFNNVSRSTSLKKLQFNMRSDSLEDLPFPVGTHLTSDQLDIVAKYNAHDVSETERFAIKSEKEIEFRRQLIGTFGQDVMNFNDTKIGKEYFVKKLEELSPGICFDRSSGRKEPRQTVRTSMDGVDIVFPYIHFEHPEFKRIHQWFLNQTLTETKGVFTDLHCTVNNFRFDFGTGGIHGSLTGVDVREDEQHSIIDLDVTAYYPSLAIVNRIYPNHLGENFCDIYADVKKQRVGYKKGTSENKMLKLALNGVYGDSNSVYSPFYDPLYTMKITINGQLLLCLLAEKLFNIPGLQLIQINTDGLTIKVPRNMEFLVEDVTRWWQDFTKLELEEARYKRMIIRDVNSYIAIGTDGKTKYKGVYLYEREHHQNHSMLVVKKAAEQELLNGWCVEDFIRSHTDPFDFMMLAKAKSGSQLVQKIGGSGDFPMQRTTRYYIAKDGSEMYTVSPPPPGCKEGAFKRANGISVHKYHRIMNEVNWQWDERVCTKNKSVYTTRRTAVDSGWKAMECNAASDFRFDNVDYDFYIQEARKLVDCITTTL